LAESNRSECIGSDACPAKRDHATINDLETRHVFDRWILQRCKLSREAAELRRAPLCRPPNLRLQWRRTLERARLGSSPFKNPDTKALISFSADFETPYFSAVSSTLSGAGGALSILKGRAATLGSWHEAELKMR